MKYEWDESIKIGYPEIDEQHRQLFAAFNEFLDACGEGRGHSEIVKTMEFLSEYVIKHFMDEERIQKENGYPDYHQHKRYHEECKIMVISLKSNFLREGPTAAVISRIQSSIGDWLLNHIKIEDMKIGEYIRARERLYKEIQLRQALKNGAGQPLTSG
ncbi:MAG: hemerythrin family protein [Synergistaceae bacterium]|jgi:hemerythrin|nr:hemerythrin family protein [Synergistaceae bacterium]